MIRIATLVVTLTGAMLIASSAPVFAADAKDLISISPPLKQITIAPGLLQADTKITLTNSSSSDVTVSIKTSDFTPLTNGSIVLGSQGQLGDDAKLAAWMSVPAGPNLVLKAGQKTDVRVLIDNRDDLTPGGHYGAVIFSTAQVNTDGTNKLALNQQLTSLFFVKKLGGEVSKMELTSLKPDKSTGLPTTATMTFKSTGNVYVIPRGYVEVTDAKGQLLAKGLINPDSILIPQILSRDIVTMMQPVAGVKSPKAPYTMTAHYRIDGEENLRTKSVSIGKASTDWIRIGIVVGLISLIVFVVLRMRAMSVKNKRR